MATNHVDFVSQVIDCAAYICSAHRHRLHLDLLDNFGVPFLDFVLGNTVGHVETDRGLLLATNNEQR